MLNPAPSQITQKLSHMLVGQHLARFQFNNQFTFDNQISNVITEDRAVLIQNLQTVLLFYPHPGLPEAVCQTVFVHFFEMPMSKETMKSERSFANLIT